MSDTGRIGAVPGVGQLSIGRVVSGTFGVLRRHLVAVGVLSLGVVAVTAVADLAYLAIDQTTAAGRFFANIFQLLVVSAVQTAATGGVTSLAVADQTGQRAAVGPATAGLRLGLPLLSLGLVMWVRVTLGFILVVPGVLLVVRWLVAVPARVVECPSTKSSLERSGELTEGNRGRVFLLCVIMFASMLVLRLAADLVGGEATADSGWVPLVLMVLVDTAVTSIGAVGAAVCYVELRRLRDGDAPSQLAAVFE